jgi:RNA polymerase sigma factor (sigma-70 family)
MRVTAIVLPFSRQYAGSSAGPLPLASDPGNRIQMPKDVRSSAAVRARAHDTGRVDPRWLPLVEDYALLLQDELTRVCPQVFGLRVDDIEQEARSKLWQSLREKRTDDPAAAPARVAARAVIDAVRRARARRKERLPAQSAEATPVDPQTRRALLVLEDIHRVLGTLSARGRLALALDLQGFTPSEIAELLDVAAPRARRLLEQGRLRIHRQVDARSWSTVWHADEIAWAFRSGTANGGGCPPAETLARAMAGDLVRAPALAVADHLAACAECCQDAQALRPLRPWLERATAVAGAPVRPASPALHARLRRFAFRSWW